MEFKPEGWKCRAENALDRSIEPSAKEEPSIWTLKLKPIPSGQRVQIIATLTKNGKKSLRIYPLTIQPEIVPPPTAFILYTIDSPKASQWGTHHLIQTSQFILCRPIEAVLRLATWFIENSEEGARKAIRTLALHAWHCGIDELPNLVERKPLAEALNHCIIAIAPHLQSTEALPEQRLLMRFARLILDKEPQHVSGIDKESLLERFSRLVLDVDEPRPQRKPDVEEIKKRFSRIELA